AYLGITLVIVLVNDGWSGRPNGIAHQLLLLPLTGTFLCLLRNLLGSGVERVVDKPWRGSLAPVLPVLLILSIFELTSLVGFGYESRHFARFGYSLRPAAACLTGAAVVIGLTGVWRTRTGLKTITSLLLIYGAGLELAIRCFPLNYLRSDMLPVISWADERLLSHANPYGTIHIGNRLYDFPYLPGMLVAFIPAAAARIDLRYITMFCVFGSALLIYAAAEKRMQHGAAFLLGTFLLSPFLQYRHDLYLAPHWLALTAAMFLLQRRHLGWASIFFGISMAIYQLSWVIFPFLLLYALRRDGLRGLIKAASLSMAGMFLVVGPFLRSAMDRIASNTVGQWSLLPHALADPINLSYWATYIVRPDQLKWVQLAVLTGVFGFCMVRGYCRTLEDMLRWMCIALTIFIALNVIVDGYFYLTLLLLMLMYTCAATGIWSDENQRETP
ncbi:MAG: hypothetical protein ACRYFU_09430, partial [Janthinobacterium lividum]